MRAPINFSLLLKKLGILWNEILNRFPTHRRVTAVSYLTGCQALKQDEIYLNNSLADMCLLEVCSINSTVRGLRKLSYSLVRLVTVAFL